MVCSVHVLYMELSYTGSLDQSTRASEHVILQIGSVFKTTAGFSSCSSHFFCFMFEAHCPWITKVHLLMFLCMGVVFLVD